MLNSSWCLLSCSNFSFSWALLNGFGGGGPTVEISGRENVLRGGGGGAVLPECTPCTGAAVLIVGDNSVWAWFDGEEPLATCTGGGAKL